MITVEAKGKGERGLEEADTAAIEQAETVAPLEASDTQAAIDTADTAASIDTDDTMASGGDALAA